MICRIHVSHGWSSCFEIVIKIYGGSWVSTKRKDDLNGAIWICIFTVYQSTREEVLLYDYNEYHHVVTVYFDRSQCTCLSTTVIMISVRDETYPTWIGIYVYVGYVSSRDIRLCEWDIRLCEFHVSVERCISDHLHQKYRSTLSVSCSPSVFPSISHWGPTLCIESFSETLCFESRLCHRWKGDRLGDPQPGDIGR